MPESKSGALPLGYIPSPATLAFVDLKGACSAIKKYKFFPDQEELNEGG